MGNETAPAAKVCRVCNQDVSSKPRQKDAQGRYVCQECLDKAKARGQGGPKKAAASAAPAGAGMDPGMAAALAGIDQGSMTACPSCGNLLKPEAALCTSCGFDVAKGKVIRTRITVEKEAKQRGDFKLPISWDIIGGGLIVLIIGTGVLSVFVPGAIVTFLIALILCQCLMWLMTVITPFQDGNTGWGMYNLFAPLLTPVMAFVGFWNLYALALFVTYPFAEIYYIFSVNWRPSLKRLFFAWFIGWPLLLVLGSLHGEKRIAESLGIELKEPSNSTPNSSAPGAVTDDGADEEIDDGASDPSLSPGT